MIDGPTGTELARRGFQLDGPLWSATACIDAPELLERVHSDYLDAGATIITANTFRTNPSSLNAAGSSLEDAGRLTGEAIAIARRAVVKSTSGKSARIAGSHAPVGDCYTPDDWESEESARRDAEAHIGQMVEAGCDLILVETMNRADEAEIALSVASDYDLPAIVSLVTDQTGRNVLDGTDLRNAARRLVPYRPEAILVNCASAEASWVAVGVLAEVLRPPGEVIAFGAYPNSGAPDPIEGWNRVLTTPIAQFCELVERMLDAGARYIGTCCGTTPDYTAMLARLIRNREGTD